MSTSFLNWEAIVQLGQIAGPLGLVIIALGFFVMWFVSKKGWSGFGDKSKMISTTRIDKLDAKLNNISSRVGHIDQRVAELENDLQDRPTKNDFHKLELQMVRQDEQIRAVSDSVKAVHASQLRIEEFLYNLAKDAK